MKLKYQITIIIAIVLLWFSTPIILSYIFTTHEEMGQFGDMFGSINALFTGIALVMIIFTVIQQRQELSLQREELKLQREEMKASREELAKQVKMQKLNYHSSIAQLKMTSMQMDVRAIELKTKNLPLNVEYEFTTNINKIKNNMDKVIRDLEKKAV